MKEESKAKLKDLLKSYLEKNNFYLYKEIWASNYTFKLNDPRKEKANTNDYQLDSFIKDFELGTEEKTNNYRFWKFIYQKDIDLAHEMVISYIKYPTKDYLKEEYIEKVLNLYTKNKKENKLLWSIINTKSFLNNNIKVVEDLFNEEVLSHIQKKEIVEYYMQFIQKSAKFNTLENKRIVSVLNEKLSKPLEISLIEEKELIIKTKTENCIYFEVKVQELMQYSLKLSSEFSENLLYQFHKLLPQVIESETSDVIPRKFESQQKLDGYGYAVLTKLNEDVIKNIFKIFVDSYVETISNQNKTPSKEDSLDCLKFAVIKARKENLENQFVPKGVKGTLKKI